MEFNSLRALSQKLGITIEQETTFRQLLALFVEFLDATELDFLQLQEETARHPMSRRIQTEVQDMTVRLAFVRLVRTICGLMEKALAGELEKPVTDDCALEESSRQLLLDLFRHLDALQESYTTFAELALPR